MCSEIDPGRHDAILDSLTHDEIFGKFFPIFQVTSTSIGHREVARLHQALDAGKAKVEDYRCLAWNPANRSISDGELAGLLEKILSKGNSR